MLESTVPCWFIQGRGVGVLFLKKKAKDWDKEDESPYYTITVAQLPRQGPIFKCLI